MRQSTAVARTVALGWKRDNDNFVAQPHGVSGAGLADRFASITAQVVLGQISIVLIQGHHVRSVRFHPDEAAKTIRTVLDRFAEMGSVLQVWLPFRSQELLIARLTAAESNVTVAA